MRTVGVPAPPPSGAFAPDVVVAREFSDTAWRARLVEVGREPDEAGLDYCACYGGSRCDCPGG
jgi:hypothetical protein